MEEYSKEELERKKKYDEILEQYVRMIETGESQEEDSRTYLKRITESMISLGIAMCDLDKPLLYNLDFIDHMLGHIIHGIHEILCQCYKDNPTGETSVGQFNVEDLKKWRKDNGM
jgi:hypothetical protein